MRIARLLYDLGRAGSLHHRLGLFLSRFDELVVVVVQVEAYVRHRQTEAVLVVRKSDAIVFPGQNLAQQTKSAQWL